MEVTSDMVLISIVSKEGYASSANKNTCIILNTELTENLIMEGTAREIVRKIQSLRKEADLVITDRINVYYNGDEEITKTLENFDEYIKNETLAIEFISKENVSEDYDINGMRAQFKIEVNKK